MLTLRSTCRIGAARVWVELARLGRTLVLLVSVCMFFRGVARS